MGFRSTFITEDTNVRWPDWFVKKWGARCWFGNGGDGVLASRLEAKTYMTWEELPADIQRAVQWDATAEEFGHGQFVLVFLHECGGITRVQIEKDRILWSEPQTWRVTEGVTHNYCYHCSDVQSTLE